MYKILFDFVTRSYIQTQTLRHIKNSFYWSCDCGESFFKSLRVVWERMRERGRGSESSERAKLCRFYCCAVSTVVFFIVRATMSLLHRPQSFIVVVFAQCIKLLLLPRQLEWESVWTKQQQLSLSCVWECCSCCCCCCCLCSFYLLPSSSYSFVSVQMHSNAQSHTHTAY